MIADNYMTTNGVLTYYNVGNEKEIMIPQEVIEIGERAFEENETVKKSLYLTVSAE